jgi:hypothetical protein
MCGEYIFGSKNMLSIYQLSGWMEVCSDGILDNFYQFLIIHENADHSSAHRRNSPTSRLARIGRRHLEKEFMMVHQMSAIGLAPVDVLPENDQEVVAVPAFVFMVEAHRVHLPTGKFSKLRICC